MVAGNEHARLDGVHYPDACARAVLVKGSSTPCGMGSLNMLLSSWGTGAGLRLAGWWFGGTTKALRAPGY